MMPTANPHTTLPSSSRAWCVAVPMRIHPTISGRVHVCKVRFRPMASIIGPDNIDPSGVAAECMLAITKMFIIRSSSNQLN